MNSIRTVMKYHATRVKTVVEGSGIASLLSIEPHAIDKHISQLKLPITTDPQAAKLMFALDTRRLVEIVAVSEVWAEYYGTDEAKFSSVGMNDFLDILYRFRKHRDDQWDGARVVAAMGEKHIGQKRRFELKYPNAANQTNSQIRNRLGLLHDYIFNATSKILHADEYSVQNHVNGDPLAWFSILVAGHSALQLYRKCPLAEPL